MSNSVVVIDYGSGNLHSVIKAFRELGCDVRVTDNPGEVERADRLVLPGVGAFADGIGGLRSRNLLPALDAYVARQRPFLGICLGMQMLFTESDEFGHHTGLNIIPGRVAEIPLRPGFKVPHIGWSRIHPRPGGSWTGSILGDTPDGTRVYFVHSFSAVPEQETDRLADTDYGGYRISAAVQRGNVIGCQFHPEKSGPIGLTMVQKFLSL